MARVTGKHDGLDTFNPEPKLADVARASDESLPSTTGPYPAECVSGGLEVVSHVEELSEPARGETCRGDREGARAMKRIRQAVGVLPSTSCEGVRFGAETGLSDVQVETSSSMRRHAVGDSRLLSNSEMYSCEAYSPAKRRGLETVASPSTWLEGRKPRALGRVLMGLEFAARDQFLGKRSNGGLSP